MHLENPLGQIQPDCRNLRHGWSPSLELHAQLGTQMPFGGHPPHQALAALAALDAQQHALGIDVADLQRDDFRDAQPGAVGGGERRLVLRRRCRLQQQRHLLDAEHHRDASRLRHDGEPPRQIRSVERHREEKAQGRDRAVDTRRLQAALRLVQLVETQILRCRRVGRPANKGRECSDVSHIVAARVLLEAAYGHVFDHAGPQWADAQRCSIGAHRALPS